MRTADTVGPSDTLVEGVLLCEALAREDNVPEELELNEDGAVVDRLGEAVRDNAAEAVSEPRALPLAPAGEGEAGAVERGEKEEAVVLLVFTLAETRREAPLDSESEEEVDEEPLALAERCIETLRSAEPLTSSELEAPRLCVGNAGVGEAITEKLKLLLLDAPKAGLAVAVKTIEGVTRGDSVGRDEGVIAAVPEAGSMLAETSALALPAANETVPAAESVANAGVPVP